jgi:hypothetical protein
VNHAGGFLLMAAITVIALALIAWAWRRKLRREGRPLITPSELPADAAVLTVVDGFYVATTEHDAPLERIAAPSLTYRSRATVTVTDAGVALDLTGQPRLLLPRSRLVDVAQASVAIDRAVEKDGLTCVVWRADGDRLVDTYLRPQDASARFLADAIRPLLPYSPGATATGTAA